MTAEDVGAVVRTLLQFVAGFLVAKGIGDAEFWTAAVPAAVALASAVWSYVYIRRKSNA